MKSLFLCIVILQISFCTCRNDTIYGVNFLLITGSNISDFVNISWNDPQQLLKDNNFDELKKSVIYIPGEKENLKSSESINDIITGYFSKRSEFNIFVLDWSPYSMLDYVQAALSLPNVADFVAEKLQMMRKLGLNLDTFHWIGFGLGSHLAGHIGRSMQNLNNYTFSRITGLDPSRLLFFPQISYLPFIMKPLNENDAQFVDIIHTSFVPRQATGHANFYPNGGKTQRGCSQNNCNHQRAYKYYSESVTYQQSDKKFKSIKCQNYIAFNRVSCTGTPVYNFMGLYAKPNATGLFYLNTQSESPFSL